MVKILIGFYNRFSRYILHVCNNLILFFAALLYLFNLSYKSQADKKKISTGYGSQCKSVESSKFWLSSEIYPTRYNYTATV